MSDAHVPEPKDALLSDEELRSLARLHAAQFRKFRENRRRERALRERENELRTLANRMAATMQFYAPPISETTTPPRTNNARVPASATVVKKTAGTPAPAKRPAIPLPRKNYAHFAPSFATTPVARFLQKIGAGGLSVSLIFHFVLIVCALFYVVSTYVETKEEPPEFFATGRGGGRDGDRPSYADVQASRRSAGKFNTAKREHKIVSKSAKSAIALPEMPELPRTALFTLAPASNALEFGNLSSGTGGGLGGGIGAGTGIGIGAGRNFVGKAKTTQKILGTNVTAEKLAVYMDNSGSMTEVIPVVRKEILKKFPTADVYEFFGCGMHQLPDEALPASKSWQRERTRLLKKFSVEKKASDARAAARKIAAQQKKNAKKNNFGYSTEETWRLALSSYGTALLNEFLKGGDHSVNLGTWLDTVVTDGGYDAIFVFADFQDYTDGSLSNEETVRERWLNSAREHGQRFYFFTTEMMPQKIFCSLAELTDGDIAIPKETAKRSFEAQETEHALKNLKQNKKSSVPADATKELPEDDDFDVPAEDEDDSETDQT